MTDQTQIFARVQYIRDHTISHEAYYTQFVTAETVLFVQNRLGVERLREALAEDEHLNAIPIKEWEALAIREISEPQFKTIAAAPNPFRARIPFDRVAAQQAGELVSRSTLVCIAKRAARMLVEQHSIPQAAAAA